MLDAAHEAMLEAFGVPPGDRYQIVSEHKLSRMIVEDTGLAMPRKPERGRRPRLTEVGLDRRDRTGVPGGRHLPDRRRGGHGLR